jgi:hypothetical protein
MDTIAELKLNWVVVGGQDSAIVDSACCEPASVAPNHSLVDAGWAETIQIIPADLEETARETKALQRRREIKQAADLLRLVLAYCVCDWSLRLVGLWANLRNIGCLSDVAVMKRVQNAKPWLESLIVAMLKARRVEMRATHPVRVRIVDGSSISIPGSQGTDYRLHLSFDLGSQRMDGIEITDVHGAETLARHPGQPGDIWLADRGYALCPGVATILKTKGEVVVRIGWATFPLESEAGLRFDLFTWLRQIPAEEPSERIVAITTPDERFCLRLIAQRLPAEAAERNRRRIRKRASRKGKTLDKRTLEAAGYILLVTSLSVKQWATTEVLALYRLRWQVELVFKRLKSILDLDQLRAKGPTLAQVYLLGKALAALIIDVMADQATRRCPMLFADTHRPVSTWRWVTISRDFLFQAVRGHVSWHHFLDKLPALSRYLCISSRRNRLNQAAAARVLLGRLLGQQALATYDLS